MAQKPSMFTEYTTVDAAFWINAAQSEIRRHCRWHVAPSVTETLILDGFGSRTLTLPSKRVTEISEVLADGVDVTESATWSESGFLRLRRGCFPCFPRSVSVSLTHGYDLEDVPEIQALIMTLARRASTGPGIIASQSTNGSSVTYQTAGGAPLSIPLLEIEKETLAPYKLNWGPR